MAKIINNKSWYLIKTFATLLGALIVLYWPRLGIFFDFLIRMSVYNSLGLNYLTES